MLDEEQGRIEVVVPDDQLSLAIGRRGQNVRLASSLTGWDIDIMTEEEESRRRQEEMRQRSEMFMTALDVDDVIAHLLVAEGFTSLEQVAFVPMQELAEIEGFDEDVAEELRMRARSHLEEADRQKESRRRELGVTDELATLQGMSPGLLVTLGENGVKTLDDLGDLAGDELRFLTSTARGETTLDDMGKLPEADLGKVLSASSLGVDEADAIIMAARAHWFDDEAPDEPTAEQASSDAAAKD